MTKPRAQMKQARMELCPKAALLAGCLLVFAGTSGLAQEQPAQAPDAPQSSKALEENQKKLEESQQQIERRTRKREESQDQLQQREDALRAAREREQELALDLARIAEERADLNGRLIETAKRIQSAEASLLKSEDRLVALSRQEEGVRNSISQRRGSLAKMLSAMQRMGRQPPPALVARRDDALKMVRSAMLMASVFPELKSQAAALTSELEALVTLGDKIKGQRDKLRTENEKLIVEQRSIGGLIAEKKALEAARRKALESVRAAAARHAKSVTRLGELVERMDEEIAAAGLAAYEAELAAAREKERLADEARRRLAPPAIELKPAEKKKVAFVDPGRLKPAVDFVKTKGTLARPVSGRQVRKFGSAQPEGGDTKGISIESRANAQVTAPADGWVAFADEFRTYGQLLIINAGGGYHVLLAGMGRIDVNVGQFVLAGEPVAVMGPDKKDAGSADGSKGPVLYVEFRNDGRPIDPGPWWAKNPERVEG